MLTNMGNRFTHYEPRFINSGQGVDLLQASLTPRHPRKISTKSGTANRKSVRGVRATFCGNLRKSFGAVRETTELLLRTSQKKKYEEGTK